MGPEVSNFGGHEQRQRNLQLIVNNARFLILPWIQSKGLASKILGLAARRLPMDWQARYGYRPVMLETFVESPRHKGTCYKAANWQLVVGAGANVLSFGRFQNAEGFAAALA